MVWRVGGEILHRMFIRHEDEGLRLTADTRPDGADFVTGRRCHGRK
jgi:hypothetical protein